ncbi:unnamed protein product [Dovyalis caffra]|uniref:Uncharacterized protein n=1 Tax=Dovyalis caffra TaxID=77055 RepID=A0AAV1RE82_9ROSI|nr:unnamed protein product [Dovyalis caffra]
MTAERTRVVVRKPGKNAVWMHARSDLYGGEDRVNSRAWIIIFTITLAIGVGGGVEMLKKAEEGGAVKEESGGVRVSSGGGGSGVHEFKKVMAAVRAKRSGGSVSGGEEVDAVVTFMTPVVWSLEKGKGMRRLGGVYLRECDVLLSGNKHVALAEWLRRVPAKYMGFPRESSNLSGDFAISVKVKPKTIQAFISSTLAAACWHLIAKGKTGSFGMKNDPPILPPLHYLLLLPLLLLISVMEESHGFEHK